MGGLEAYFYRRLGVGEKARVEWGVVGMVLVVGVAAWSLANGYRGSPTLSSNSDEVVREAAKRGDYETARRIYEYWQKEEDARVLGVESEVEELVYPEKMMERKVREAESLLARYPGHRDLVLNLALLSYWVGNYEEARKYLEQARKLDPNTEKLRLVEEELGIGLGE